MYSKTSIFILGRMAVIFNRRAKKSVTPPAKIAGNTVVVQYCFDPVVVGLIAVIGVALTGVCVMSYWLI